MIVWRRMRVGSSARGKHNSCLGSGCDIIGFLVGGLSCIYRKGLVLYKRAWPVLESKKLVGGVVLVLVKFRVVERSLFEVERAFCWMSRY
jgi:hypothetical protein